LSYTQLSGIEIQSYAIERALQRVPFASIAEGSALSIPYGDQEFDLVFTSGVLIHIAPEDLSQALGEIHRVAKTWIWGLEYYAPAATEILYRGHQQLLWKNNFVQMYRDRFADIELLHEEHLPYLNDENSDTMFLFKRKS
jgi:pseudaminic acid biosynthesis-associated methylase